MVDDAFTNNAAEGVLEDMTRVARTNEGSRAIEQAAHERASQDTIQSIRSYNHSHAIRVLVVWHACNRRSISAGLVEREAISNDEMQLLLMTLDHAALRTVEC